MFEPNLDWGNHGGKCIDCFELEPCCGKPCNVKDGCYCFWCFACCGSCVLSKLWASSMDHKMCGLVNHWGPWFCVYLLIVIGDIIMEGGYFLGVAINSSLVAQLLALGAIIPYIMSWVLQIALMMLIRVNLRRKYSIGDPAVNACDCFLVFCPCTEPCIVCQELRAVEDIQSWDWLGQCMTHGLQLMTEPIKLTPRETVGGGTSGAGYSVLVDETKGLTD